MLMQSYSLMKIVSPCWRPSPTDDGGGGDDGPRSFGRAEGLLWYKDLGRHAAGEFSMAVVQANNLMEDSSQIESGPLDLNGSWPASGGGSSSSCGTFVGVYDGHGGPETSRYITDNLFRNLKRDSRAVLGRWLRGEREVSAVQVSTEHNASIESVREELRSLHPDDPHIVVLKHKVWRVKGIIQISKSIGDAYLKDAEFNQAPLISRFRLPKPFHKSILSAEPSIFRHKLSPQDQFIIFASDGLWEHLSNQEAVDIVHQYPRNGIARRLIKAAMKEAAKKREMRYSDLKKIERGVRRHFHDDITVVVLYLDPGLIRQTNYNGPVLSLRGGGGSTYSPILKF